MTMKESILKTEQFIIEKGVADHFESRGIPRNLVISDFNALMTRIKQTEPKNENVIALFYTGMRSSLLEESLRFYRKEAIIEYAAAKTPFADLMDMIVLPPYEDTDYLYDHIEKYGRSIDIFRMTTAEIHALIAIKRVLPNNVRLSVEDDLARILGATVEGDLYGEARYISMGAMEQLLLLWKPDRYVASTNLDIDALSELYSVCSLHQTIKATAEKLQTYN